MTEQLNIAARERLPFIFKLDDVIKIEAGDREIRIVVTIGASFAAFTDHLCS